MEELINVDNQALGIVKNRIESLFNEDFLQESEENNDREKFVQWLVPRILNLIEYRFEGLAQLMYRVDIPEPVFAAAFEGRSVQETAVVLANLTIDREIKKAKTRIAFQQQSQENNVEK